MWDYRDYDLSNTRSLLMWGCGPLSSNRLTPATIRHFGDLLDRATVAVVDPKLPEQEDLSALGKVKLKKFGEQPAPALYQPKLQQGSGGTMVCGNPSFEKPRGRGPQDPMEKWAMEHLPLVAAMDKDHARVQNGMGFSKMDSDFGHNMAAQAQKGTATDKQWFWIVKLARKYQKQIGHAPTGGA